ncbi:MAG: hypothetical protein CSH37_06320 [Thalassolituus sp.]|jgi:hypothetical protein|nr:MAG: hypothetical protein CSH37_06320 [Thalassolituus sp.]|tara:strand:+ start:3124 stop:3414 length:291 start_codon:yes stop_codon:yes gene_type:complete
MFYFKRDWDDTRGDRYDFWGCSEWWIETNNEGYITRCIQKYRNGNILFYSEGHQEDKYGALPEGALDVSEFKEFRITRFAFEKAISKFEPMNLKES